MGEIAIKFTPDPRLTFTNMLELRTELSQGAEIMQKHKQLLATMRNNVVEKLKMLSKRDPAATKDPTGKFTGAIAENITAEVTRNGPITTGGVGKIELLDTQDPLFLGTEELGEPPRQFKNDLVRLWRILDFGTRGDYPISARTKPLLHFFHQRYGTWIKTKTVTHPGQEGRFYWKMAQEEYDFSREFFRQMSFELDKVVKKYSAKV